MAIRFHGASTEGLNSLTGVVPAGAIVGIISDDGAALEALARLASGLTEPAAGSVSIENPALFVDHCKPPEPAAAQTLVMLHPTRLATAYEKAVWINAVDRARRHGSAVLLISHDQEVLRVLSDEIWWIDGTGLRLRAAPPDALEAYNRHVANRLAELPQANGLHPSLRRGDGRARLLAIETLDGEGRPTAVWKSGAIAGVRLGVRFEAAVPDPVIGIMIRTRVGFEVFGTNTELERLSLGPVAAGESLQVTFRFRCDLCPQEYTLTAASHDPDGIWHDWLEDAVAVAVADSRFTAGVANLHAEVTAEKT